MWEVKIDGVTYALKMFRHIRAEEENAASPARLEQFGVDLQLLNDQLTPFNCEARAYGRLHETEGSEDIAWGCDGYVILSEAEYGAVVWDTIRLERKAWFSSYINTDAEVADRPVFPIYALVKEFITDAGRLGALDITKAHDMAQTINRLHSIGITHRDSKCAPSLSPLKSLSWLTPLQSRTGTMSTAASWTSARPGPSPTSASTAVSGGTRST